MMKYWNAVYLAGSLGLASCSPAHDASSQVMRAERAQELSVALMVWTQDTGEGRHLVPEGTSGAELTPMCSGAWIDHDVILTAAHCVEMLGRPKLDPLQQLLEILTGQKSAWDPTGQPALFSMSGDLEESRVRTIETVRHGRVTRYDAYNDLALIQHDPVNDDDVLPDHPIARIAKHVSLGEEVDLVGHPLDVNWTYAHGWVSHVRPWMEGPEHKRIGVIQISAPIWYGFSGGGVFNQSGELVGITSFLKKAPNLGFAIDPPSIRAFLAH